MSYALTTNWGDIQKRTVDPYDNVNSDVVNQVYKVFGSGHAFVEGFGIVEQYLDALENRVAIKLEKGIAYVGGILIQITADTTINLFTVPNTVQQDYYIVLEYEFSKSQPIPQAIIRSVKAVDYSSNKQLILHKYTIPIYTAMPTETSWNNWIVDPNNYKDYRFNTGYLKRKGDIVTGPLVLNFTPSMDSHAVSKKWVEDFLGTAGGTFNPSLYLKKAGDTVSGPLLCGTGALPSAPNEYVTKNYIDITALKLTGGTMTGSLVLQSNNYLAGDHAAIDKKFADDTFVSKNGSTMTGMLILAQDPSTPMGAATKQYVDEHAGGGSGTPVDAVLKTGDTMTGYLTLNANPVAALHAATKGYVDAQVSAATGGTSAADCIKRSGDAMTGPIGLTGDPGTDNEAARKKYVDDQIAARAVLKNGAEVENTFKVVRDVDHYLELNAASTPSLKIASAGGEGSISILDETDNLDNFSVVVAATNETTMTTRSDMSISSGGKMTILSTQEFHNTSKMDMSATTLPEFSQTSGDGTGAFSIYKSGTTDVLASMFRTASSSNLFSNDTLNISTNMSANISALNGLSFTTPGLFTTAGIMTVKNTNSTFAIDVKDSTDVTNSSIIMNVDGMYTTSKSVNIKSTGGSVSVDATGDASLKATGKLTLNADSIQLTSTLNAFQCNNFSLNFNQVGLNYICTMANANMFTILGASNDADCVSCVNFAQLDGSVHGVVGVSRTGGNDTILESFGVDNSIYIKSGSGDIMLNTILLNSGEETAPGYFSTLHPNLFLNSRGVVTSPRFISTNVPESSGFAELFDLESSLVAAKTSHQYKVFGFSGNKANLLTRNDTTHVAVPVAGIYNPRPAFTSGKETTTNVPLIVSGTAWVVTKELDAISDYAAALASFGGKLAVVSDTDAGYVESIDYFTQTENAVVGSIERSKVGTIIDVDVVNKRYRVRL